MNNLHHKHMPESDSRGSLTHADTIEVQSGRIESKEPQTAVFWLVEGVLLLASTTICVAPESGPTRLHSSTHEAEWSRYQSVGMFPGVPHDHHPRGRVQFHINEQRFTIFADLCLLPDAPLFNELDQLLNVPPSTEVRIDGEYACYCCRAMSRV